jgi:hypothetical protein
MAPIHIDFDSARAIAAEQFGDRPNITRFVDWTVNGIYVRALCGHRSWNDFHTELVTHFGTIHVNVLSALLEELRRRGFELVCDDDAAQIKIIGW